MAKAINYIGKIFGNREIISNTCQEKDWIKLGLKVPSQDRQKKYKLTKCLRCGTILPSDLINLRRQPPKRCAFCSGIGYKGSNPNLLKTNNVYINCNDGRTEIIIYYKDKPYSCYIDTKNVEKVQKYKWRLSKKRNKFYAVTGQQRDNSQMYLHNYLMDDHTKKYQVDHKDGNSLNNTLQNLRIVTTLENQQNYQNVRIDNEIGIRGISYSKRDNKYKVDFSFNHKRYYTKSWDTIEEAIYCRKVFEDYFNFNMLQNNPEIKKYNQLPKNKQIEIFNYVHSKISGN